MIDKLNNLEIEPDVEVWEKVNKTLRRKVWTRRGIGVFAVTSIVALSVSLWPSSRNAEALMEEVQVAQTVVDVATQEAPSVVSVVVSDPNKVEPLPELQVVSQGPLEEVSAMTGRQEEPVVVSRIYSDPVLAQPVCQDQPQIMVSDMRQELSDLLAAIEDDVADLPVEEKVQTSQPKNAEQEEFAFVVPKVFAPNGTSDEGRTFKITCTQPVKDFQLFIFARNGREVYRTTDMSAGWDGKKNGSLMPQAAYVYVIKYKGMSGYPHTKTGTVTLIR